MGVSGRRCKLNGASLGQVLGQCKGVPGSAVSDPNHIRRFPALCGLLALCLLLWAAAAQPATGPVQDTGHARARLLSAVDAVAPGQTLWVALDLELDRGWHTYWRNAGDSGRALQLDWTLPPGVQAGPLQWPAPQRIPTPPFMTYGYEDAATVLSELRLPAGLRPGEQLQLHAEIEVLVCKTLCLPQTASLRLDLPVAAVAVPDARRQREIAAARSQVPRPWPALAASLHALPSGALALHLPWPAQRAAPQSLYFFPYEKDRIEHAAPQPVRRTAEGYRLDLPLSEYAPGTPQRLAGVLAVQPGLGVGGALDAVALELALADTPAPPVSGPDLAAAPSAVGAGATGLLGGGLAAALLLAFAGGMILNLMPCVFPVVGIKVLGFAEQARGSRRSARLHGLAFSAGVLVCFWILAAALLALRAAGEQVGWGFQLQTPGFVAAMALLVFAIGLNLLGTFEIGGRLMQLGAAGAGRGGLAGSFGAGVLAAVVATPCTAPFMGAALGYAVSQPVAAALAVFTALALGFCAPYLLLGMAPGLLRRLPRPGPWMHTLRQVLAFPMFLTAVWLAWVLGRQQGVNALGLLLVALVALAFAAFMWGRAQRGARGPATALLGLAAFGLALVLGAAATRMAAPPAQAVAAGWEDWAPAAVARYRAQGEPVFVDFTADWCITCKVNKRLALDAPSVRAAMQARGVRRLRADWTRHDPVITEALARFGRSGVPLYLYYPPHGPPRVLPELLTPGLVLAALDG